MAIVDDDILRYVVSLQMPSSVVAQNVYHYQYEGTGDTEAHIGATLKTQMLAAYANMGDEISDLVDGLEVDMLVWDSVLNEWHGVYGDDFAAFNPATADDMLPHGAAALIRLLTPIPKRQGRKFIPGLTEARHADGIWIAGAIANLALMSADLLGSPISTNGVLNPGVFTEATESFLRFTNSAIINSFVSYQRRRRPGVGI